MRFHPLIAGIAAMLACAQLAIAEDRQNLDANAILTQQREIRAGAEVGEGRYQAMKPGARRELYKNQDLVTGLLQGKAYTTELPEHDQVAVFNALESIEAILNDAEDQRMICERHKPTGSHRTQTMCRTVAQRRAMQEAAKNEVTYRDQQCTKDVRGECL